MPRALRIEYKDASYHIMNRGAGKKKIFHTRGDYLLFLNILDEITNRYQIQIHAYCLMPNHYHLLISTPWGNLSRAMKYVNGLYTQRYNKLRRTDGPLFRGRFKSLLVEENEYFLILSRYIHLNPVVAQIVKKPEQYEWSSYNAYLKPNKAPHWIITEYTLDKFDAKSQQQKYSAFVEEGIPGCKTESDVLAKKMRCKFILGTEAFIKIITEKYLANNDPSIDDSDGPIKKRLLPKRNTSFIIKVVSDHYQIDPKAIKAIKRQTGGNRPRNIAIYLSCLLSNQKLQEIGIKFSGISRYAVSKTYRKMRDKIAKNTSLSNEVEAIKNKITKNS